MDELKPCPFCGSSASVTETKVYCEPVPIPEYGIRCDICRCELKSGYSNKKTAIRAWNRRQLPVFDETNKDLISRQEVIRALHRFFNHGFESDEWWNSTHVLQALHDVPTAYFQDNKQGWDGEIGFRHEYLGKPWKGESDD